MGKNRTSRSRSGGTEPQTGDMEIPEDRTTITELPQEDPGTKTTLQQNNEKVQQEIDDLTMDLFDQEIVLSKLGAERHDALDKIEKIQNNMERYQTLDNATDAGMDDLRYQLRLAQEDYGRVDLLYQEQIQKINDIEQRLQTLETGFDTGSGRWVNEENDDGL